jgi:hypothetical protein
MMALYEIYILPKKHNEIMRRMMKAWGTKPKEVTLLFNFPWGDSFRYFDIHHMRSWGAHPQQPPPPHKKNE